MVIASPSTELRNGMEPSRVWVVCQHWIKYKFLVSRRKREQGRRKGWKTYTYKQPSHWPKSFAGCASPLDEAQKLPTNAHKHIKRSRTHTLAILVLTPHLRSGERDFCQIPLKLTQRLYQTYKAGLCCRFSS